MLCILLVFLTNKVAVDSTMIVEAVHHRGKQMQTVEQFAEVHNIKSHKTIEHWCEKGYIPGAKKIEILENQQLQGGQMFWLIPDHAMLPYTENRYRKGTSPYFSMMSACVKQKHIVPALYDMDEERFQSYIDDLVQAGFIRVYLDKDGIPHYTETVKGSEAVKAGNRKFTKLMNDALKFIGATVQIASGVAAIV